MSTGAIAAANNWKLGTNTVSWDSLTAIVSFQTDPRATIPVTASKRFAGYDIQLPAPSNSQLCYYVGQACATRAFREVISVVYRGSPYNNGALDSCDGVQVAMANSFNAWNMPINPVTIPSASFKLSCSSNTVVVSATSIPAGYHIFVDAYQVLSRDYAGAVSLQIRITSIWHVANIPYTLATSGLRGLPSGPPAVLDQVVTRLLQRQLQDGHHHILQR